MKTELPPSFPKELFHFISLATNMNIFQIINTCLFMLMIFILILFIYSDAKQCGSPSSSIKFLNSVFWEKTYNMGINDFLGQVLYYFNQIVLQNFWNFFFQV
jgi:hypothetical protein